MTTSKKTLSWFITAIFMLSTVSIFSIDDAFADSRYEHNKYSKKYKQSSHHYEYKHKHKYKHRQHVPDHVIHRGPRKKNVVHRTYHYRDVKVIRHHGPEYGGYGYFFHDSDAYPWLAFTAITLKILDNVNENQQRAHEAAQVKASVAPIGERIIWHEGAASGSVTPIRDGTSTSGRYCREFQHDVKIGGRNERAYGTACRKPDGSWEVISSSSY